VPSVKSELRRFTAVLDRKALTALKLLLRAEVVPAIVTNLMRAYDSEMAGRAPAGDKASPEEPIAREAFEKIIRESLQKTLVRSNNTVSVSAGNIEQLRLNLAGSASSLESHLKSVGNNPWVLDWLIFYLEGFGGEFAFISKDTYDKFIKAGVVISRSDADFKRWGWYHSGFMISRAAYEARAFSKVVPFASVRHPQSGMRPAKIFEHAMDGIDMRAVYHKAIRMALGGA